MSTTTPASVPGGPSAGSATRTAAPTGARTTVRGRLTGLARAELILLGRSKGTLFAALLVPLALPFSVRSAVDGIDLEKQGLSPGTVLLPGAIGFSLLFAVYSALLTVFVARREELVLKRLRTGELRDMEILAGAALPASLIGLVQSILLAAGCTVLLDVPAPHAPLLAAVGLLAGIVLCATLAAVTASLSRTTESAQVTGMPLLVVSLVGSGLVAPLEVLPDRIASVCRLLPLSPVTTLVRGGWTGGLSTSEVLGALLVAAAWIVLGGFAVRRWFRWDPRR